MRSDAQGVLLANLFMNPAKGYTIADLARKAETSIPTIMREVDRLKQAGVITEELIGRARFVRANANHPLFETVRALALYGYGPVPVLTPLLQNIDGLKSAVIYGSWAERNAGIEGADPGDIDVMLIGDVSWQDQAKIAELATAEIGKTVNVNRSSEEDWNTPNSGFMKTVKSRPMVELKIAN